MSAACAQCTVNVHARLLVPGKATAWNLNVSTCSKSNSHSARVITPQLILYVPSSALHHSTHLQHIFPVLQYKLKEYTPTIK